MTLYKAGHKSIKILKDSIIPVLILNLYLILYVVDVYEMKMPVSPSSVRIAIVLLGYSYVIVKILFYPKLRSIEMIMILYALTIIFGLFINDLLTFSKAANDLFFPLVCIVFARAFSHCTEKQIIRTIHWQISFLLGFFLLFLYAAYVKKLGFGLYLNSCYYCALLLPFAVCVRKPALRNILIMICLIPSILALKRGAFIAVIVGVIFFFGAIRKSEEFNKHRRKYVLWAVGTVFCTGLVLIYMRQYMQLDIVERLLQSSDDGGSGRTHLYREMLSLIGQSDLKGWIIGHGSYTSAAFLGTSSHNDFLEMIWSYGIVGFALYFCMFVHFYKVCKTLKTEHSIYYPPYLVAFVEFVICSFISQLVFVPTYVAFVLMFFSMAESWSINKQSSKGRVDI